MSLKKLNSINKDNIRAAGPRYSPSIDPKAPNLEIKPLVNAVEALSLTDRYRARVSRLGQEITDSWISAPKAILSLFKKQKTPIEIVDLLNNLQKQGAGKSTVILDKIEDETGLLIEKLEKKRNELWDKQRETKQDSDEHRAIQSEISSMRPLEDALGQLMGFIRSPDFNLIRTNRMLMLGKWGTGKTHFLCDVTRDRMARNLPTLFLLAYRLPVKDNPLLAICKATKTAKTPNDLLRLLNDLGKKQGGRALIIVDGINEGNRPIWRKYIEQITRLVSRYSNVGIILSCRSPFEEQIFTSQTRRSFVEIHHTGFEEIEFDAQTAFFTFYGIPYPHIPLLTPEFSRPLFLKILCQTFSGKTSTTKTRWIREIAAGQKTMIKLFEDFINQVGSLVEIEHGLKHKTCWQILKGHKTSSGEVVGIAVSMAQQLKDYISKKECLLTVQTVTGRTNKESRQIIEKMMVEGLLLEDIVWEDSSKKTVIRLPYQRFSDHLIARHLVDNFLNTSSIDAVCRSFYRNKPLGRIFEIDTWGHGYRTPGLASAVMLEFPERVKRVLPKDERELVFYLPKKRRLVAPLVDVFLEGLLWRGRNSFSKQTDRIIGILLDRTGTEAERKTFEVLVSLACRPEHPYSSERLQDYLRNKQLPDRDLSWSEYLRNAYASSAIHRVLDWIEGPGQQVLQENTARHMSILLSLFLTTTHRPIRDRVTRLLVSIGDKYPEVLFNVTIDSLKFNDPYIPERMLAASYGVAMRSWAFPSKAVRDSLPLFACRLYDTMFLPGSPYSTKHILSRDYALGVIELARMIKKSCLGRRSLKNLKPPFVKSAVTIPAPRGIRENRCKPADGALHMDFENYTIGRLVRDRHNYDSTHKEYRGVLRQIKWRILKLGYDDEKFKNVDRQIADRSFYWEQRDRGGKIDRYGKKYSWIAFYEVAGMRADLGLLPERYAPRLSDSDIDPSFPETAKNWNPPLKNAFSKPYTSARTWVSSNIIPSYDHFLQLKLVDGLKGPWALLYGFINEAAQDDPRKVFTFLKGVFVKSSDISKLRRRFNSREYPGNLSIPEAFSDYYTFAGEIPWSKKYGFEFFKPGESKRHIDECFSETRTFSIRKKVAELSEADKFSIGGRFITLIHDDLVDEAGKKAEEGEPAQYADVPQHITIPGINVEIPTHDLVWEGYHSTENDGGSVDYLAPALCDYLKLRNRGNSRDLYDTNGNLATLLRVFGDDSIYSRSTLFYVRKDQLKEYLLHTDQKLVWFIWGERDLEPKTLEAFSEQLQDIWSSHRNIHKKMKVARI